MAKTPAQRSSAGSGGGKGKEGAGAPKKAQRRSTALKSASTAVAKKWWEPGSPLREELLTRLSHGESLRAICKDDKFPDESAVRQRALKDDEFAPHYARARELGLYSMADEIIEISDQERVFKAGEYDAAGNLLGYREVDNVTRAKLAADNRKWLLSKLLHKVFGDKTQHTLTTQEIKKIEVKLVSPDPARPRARLVNGQYIDVTPEEGDDD